MRFGTWVLASRSFAGTMALVLGCAGTVACSSGDGEEPRPPDAAVTPRVLPPMLHPGDRLRFRWRRIGTSERNKKDAVFDRDYTVSREVTRRTEVREDGAEWVCLELRQSGGDAPRPPPPFTECYSARRYGSLGSDGRVKTLATRAPGADADRHGAPRPEWRGDPASLTYWSGDDGNLRLIIDPLLGKIVERDTKLGFEYRAEFIGRERAREGTREGRLVRSCNWDAEASPEGDLRAGGGWPAAVTMERGRSGAVDAIRIGSSAAWPTAVRVEVPGAVDSLKSWFDASANRWWVAVLSREPEHCRVTVIASDAESKWTRRFHYQGGERCGFYLLQRFDPAGDTCELATWAVAGKGGPRRGDRFVLSGPRPMKRDTTRRGEGR